MKEKPVVGIATDGAHSAKERLTRFRAVDLSSGKELFSKAIGNWTNNIGGVSRHCRGGQICHGTSGKSANNLLGQHYSHHVVL